MFSSGFLSSPLQMYSPWLFPERSTKHFAKSFLIKSFLVCKCSLTNETIFSIIKVFNFLKYFLKMSYFCKMGSQEPTYFNSE